MGKVRFSLIHLPRLLTRILIGPLYDPTSGILHFVDIIEKRVFHYDTQTHALSFDQFDEAVTALAIRANGEGVSLCLGLHIAWGS